MILTSANNMKKTHSQYARFFKPVHPLEESRYSVEGKQTTIIPLSPYTYSRLAPPESNQSHTTPEQSSVVFPPLPKPSKLARMHVKRISRSFLHKKGVYSPAQAGKVLHNPQPSRQSGPSVVVTSSLTAAGTLITSRTQYSD